MKPPSFSESTYKIPPHTYLLMGDFYMESKKRTFSSEQLFPTPSSVAQMLGNKEFSKIKSLVNGLKEADLAELLAEIKEEYALILYRLLPKELAARVFVEMPTKLQEDLINSFSDAELASTLDLMYMDDTVDIIEEMPAGVVKRILKASAPENRDLINRLLKYPQNSAGAMMTTEYLHLREQMTVEDALAHVREVAGGKENIYTCYVTEQHRRLVGVITLKELLLSGSDKKIYELMKHPVIFAKTMDEKDSVGRKFSKYGFLTLPVVDNELRLVGIITVDDVIDAIEEEREEDFAKMAAITPSEESYLKRSPLAIWKSRIGWLLLLMVSATFSSAILSRFEAFLPTVFLLFIPMLMDTGGNSGSQSSVTVIRAISVGEVSFSKFHSVFFKELAVGILTGLTLGSVAFVKIMAVDRWLMSNESVTLVVAFSASVTLCITVITAKLLGATLPLLAKKIGLDPAVMASPFITTATDIISLVVYFAIASVAI